MTRCVHRWRMEYNRPVQGKRNTMNETNFSICTHLHLQGWVKLSTELIVEQMSHPGRRYRCTRITTFFCELLRRDTKVQVHVTSLCLLSPAHNSLLLFINNDTDVHILLDVRHKTILKILLSPELNDWRLK